jgi:predicted ATPase/DNA-binding SARP family transcriptional activator
VEVRSIEVRLLGPVEASADGQALPLGGRRQRALLALLALEPGRRVPAETVAEELWQGAPPAGAQNTLRTYVSRLRQALGRDAVVAQAGGYALTVDADRLDVSRFERLVREGREALTRGAAGLASERLCAALELWRGRALADVSDGGMLASEALRLDELRLTALEDRIEADLALARHAEVVPELRALVQQHPLRERLWRQLVLALYRSGQQADALAAYRDARGLLDSELGLEPSPELQELERSILRHEVDTVPAAERRHNLPAALADIVGRERELTDLERLLREHRLVTVTGLGGTGKTRLALEVARRQVDAWSAGVWLVDLTELADDELVVGAVAAVLGVPDGQDERLRDALIAHAQERELLLVLDNCEHVAAACAEVVHALLRGCANVRVLATSRVPLDVRGELDYALDPLAEESAVRLFIERATAIRRDIADLDGARATVVDICRELDGLPLAIELAAARVKALSLEDIAERLDDRFRFLRAWQRVADPRHRTLATTMDWSYGLLSAEEKRMLRRLSIFAGGAGLEAVVEVCGDSDDERALEVLGRLVSASLVRAEAGERMRYRLLETVRQYASALFLSDADAEEVRRRHAHYYLRLAVAAHLALDAIGHGTQHHAPVLREQHNIRAAIDWATAADLGLAAELTLALENFWITHALTEGRRRFEEIVGRAQGLDRRLQARLFRDYAGCLDVLQDFETARCFYERSRDLFRELGDAVAVAHLDFRVGVVIANHDEDLERARSLWEGSLETCRRERDPIGELQLLGNLGRLELLDGDRERGLAMIERSIAMAREEGWLWWQTQWLNRLAEVHCAEGRWQDAEQRGREALELAREMGNGHYARYALAVLARAAALRGDAQRSRALWSVVEAAEEPPGRFGRFDREEYLAVIPDGPPPGPPLTIEEAVTLALSD